MYHVTPDGPRRCKAQQGGCPYASQADSHFEHADQAQHQYEKNMKAQYGVVPVLTRSAKVRLRTYRRLDEGAKLKNFLSQPSRDNYQKYRQMSKIRKALNDRDDMRSRRGRGGVGGGRRGGRSRRRGSLPMRMLRGTVRSFTRPVVKSVRKMKPTPKKMLLTKYWMPNIHSNKWR